MEQNTEVHTAALLNTVQGMPVLRSIAYIEDERLGTCFVDSSTQKLPNILFPACCFDFLWFAILHFVVKYAVKQKVYEVVSLRTRKVEASGHPACVVVIS